MNHSSSGSRIQSTSLGADEIRDVTDSRGWDATVEQVAIDSDVRERIQNFTTTGLQP